MKLLLFFLAKQNNAFATFTLVLYKIQTCRRGSAAELCTNLGVIICPLNYHVALMRLQGWIIHFQPNFLLNWLSWSFSECEPLWQLGYLTLFFRFVSANFCLWIEESLSSVLSLSTAFQTPNWVSLTVWIVILIRTVQQGFVFFPQREILLHKCYLCHYPSSQLFSLHSFCECGIVVQNIAVFLKAERWDLNSTLTK